MSQQGPVHGEVIGFTSVSPHLGNSQQAAIIEDYLREIGAKTCVVEKEYVDRDYMIDYQSFYCRSFDPEISSKNKTTRLNFFKDVFSQENFETWVTSGNTEELKKLHYLGFVVIKPICDRNHQPLIGRTCVETYTLYPADKPGIRRKYLEINNHASFFGFTYNVRSIPYQVQDQAVSACASIALWQAFYCIADDFDIPKLSPYEITRSAVALSTEHRSFPQVEGLGLNQMINCIQSLGLEIELINTEDLSDDAPIISAIRAYIEAEIPLIAILKIYPNGHPAQYQRHAVTITGYQSEIATGKVTELYVHDDQIGPYMKVIPVNDFRKWSYEWCQNGRYEVQLENLLVPLYHKIRQPFTASGGGIYEESAAIPSGIAEEADVPVTDLETRLFLKKVQTYKNELLTGNIEDKYDSLAVLLPRYVWVVELYYKNRHIIDFVYDSTSVFPSFIRSNKFN